MYQYTERWYIAVDLLECYIAVCETKRISKAAAKLFISPSAVSRKISALEREVGHELFIRTKPNLALTPEGKIVLDYARHVIAERSIMLERLNTLGQAKPLTLHLGYQNLHQSRWISSLTAVMKARCPNVHIRMERAALPKLNELLKSGELDAIFDIYYTDNFPDDKCYKAFPLTLYAAMSAFHPLARRESVSISELAEESFLLLKRELAPQIFDRITDLCTQSGFTANVTAYFDASEDITAAIAAGQGITLTDDSARIFESANITFVPITDHKPKMQWLLLWNADNTNPAIPSLRDALVHL